MARSRPEERPRLERRGFLDSLTSSETRLRLPCVLRAGSLTSSFLSATSSSGIGSRTTAPEGAVPFALRDDGLALMDLEASDAGLTDALVDEGFTVADLEVGLTEVGLVAREGGLADFDVGAEPEV